ncbi:MAG: hypothetical protein SFW67_18900 [Myxococcaceae bacterium]|nr:hypothetical protein [Myxococcaceae bacterium]
MLLAPNTGVPMATWPSGSGDKNRWTGAKLTGGLKLAGPHFVLEGVWEGDGIRLFADVAASEEPVFFSMASLPFGKAGMLGRGTALRVVDAPGNNRVRVAPEAEALQVFTPDEPAVAEVSCEALSLYPQEGDALQWAGVDPNAPVRALDVTAAVPLLDAPGGARLGTLSSGKEPLLVRQLEVRDGWVRIAVGIDWVWQGWVKGELGDPPAAGLGGLGFRYNPRPEGLAWKACAVEQRLYARIGGRPLAVGFVAPVTPFSPGAEADGYVAVKLRSALEAQPGVEFLLEASAAKCGPWVEPPNKSQVMSWPLERAP